jgi:hypothetical protein
MEAHSAKFDPFVADSPFIRKSAIALRGGWL